MIRAQLNARGIVVLVLLVAGFAVGLFLAVDQAVDRSTRASAGETRDQILAVLKTRRQQNVKGCRRSNGDRRADLERDADQRDFARAAAIARQRSGDMDVARQYHGIARRAVRRRVRVSARIVVCTKAYPPIKVKR